MAPSDTATSDLRRHAQAMWSSLSDRSRITARPGFNRWLVPPAALAIHLCIGMIYGMSVFWLPLTRGAAAACGQDGGFWAMLTATSCNWTVGNLVVGFEIAIVFLGASAAIWGGWLERVGPRLAGVVAALLWSAGLLVMSRGVYLHQLWIVWLGLGAVGGIGLGIGYISPVSTLVKWFPDRRGMATGMAIMGFGGGAMIGAPLATSLMGHFADATGPGVWQTLLVLAAIYAAFMLSGAAFFRVPPPNWTPAGWTNPQLRRASPASGHVHLTRAARTPQFWLIWVVLLTNVSAGIGVLSVASPLLQQLFGASPATAAGFVGLLSVFNIGGRFVWASLSDRLGRRTTYAVLLLLGIAFYAAAPAAAHAGDKALFVTLCCLILSLYGGGFAMLPAYLADIFGTRFVGAIHGRLLTAWSTAGVAGPLLVGTITRYSMQAGVGPGHLYDQTLYVMAGLLVVGAAANFLVRPLAPHRFMTPAELASPGAPAAPADDGGGQDIGGGTFSVGVAGAWLSVLLPIGWGFYVTLSRVSGLL